MSGRVWVNHIFVLKRLFEKYREKKDLQYVELEKAVDEVCIEELRRVLYEY